MQDRTHRRHCNGVPRKIFGSSGGSLLPTGETPVGYPPPFGVPPTAKDGRRGPGSGGPYHRRVQGAGPAGQLCPSHRSDVGSARQARRSLRRPLASEGPVVIAGPGVQILLRHVHQILATFTQEQSEVESSRRRS